MDLKLLRYPAGDGDLPGARGVVPLHQGEHRAAVGAVRVQRPVFDGLGRAGDGHELAANHLNGAERLPGCRDVCRHGLLAGPGELQEVVGGAELRTRQGRHVVGGRHAEGRSPDCQGQQRQHQDLLPPLPAQQPPCPPGHDPPASGAAADGARQSRAVVQHHAHRCAPGASSESGPEDAWA